MSFWHKNFLLINLENADVDIKNDPPGAMVLRHKPIDCYSVTFSLSSYELIGLAVSTPEDVKVEIVESKWDEYDNRLFKIYDSDQEEYTHDIDDSFESIFRSHNLNPSKTVILRQYLGSKNN